MVRKIDVTGTVGTWGAITELMRTQIRDDTFEDTIVSLTWSDDPPSLALGNYEDADQLDVETAREAGLTCGRVYQSGGGGSGVFTSATPLFLMFYEHDEHDAETNSLLDHFDEINGRANAAALNRVGLDAEYRSIGDTEIVIDDNRYKVMASSAANFQRSNYWAAVTSIIWDPLPDEYARVMDEAIDVPREKFQDKDTDSLTSRMRPVSSIIEEYDRTVTREDVMNALVREHVDRIVGEDEPVEEATWTDEEATFIREMAPFFESDAWIDRVSTADLCHRAPSDFDLGIAAYKSRKLIKVSLILDDDGLIHDVLFSGDFYFRPLAPVTSTSLLDELAVAVRGLDPTDRTAVESAIAGVFDRPSVEFPRISAEDFAIPVERAAANTRPVASYLADQ